MKKIIKKYNNIKVLASIVIIAIISISCNNANKSKEKVEQEVKPEFNLDEAKTDLQTSVIGFKEAMAKGDAKTAANYYTTDAVFMPNNGPIVTGRGNIEKALGGFIATSFTKLDVQSTWLEGCNDYLMDTEKWTLTNGKDTIVGKSLVIWKKEEGIWKQYKDMINTDTP
jgi:ketosteroid isomerase-like protein